MSTVIVRRQYEFIDTYQIYQLNIILDNTGTYKLPDQTRRDSATAVCTLKPQQCSNGPGDG